MASKQEKLVERINADSAPSEYHQRTRKMTPEAIEFVRANFHTMTNSELAAAIKVSKPLLARYTRVLGLLKRRASYNELPQDVSDKIKSLLAGPLSYAKIAAEVGCSPATVRNHAETYGIKRLRAVSLRFNKITEETAQKIIAAYQRGIGCRIISKNVGLSHQGVLNVLRKCGVEPRERGDTTAIARSLAEEIFT